MEEQPFEFKTLVIAAIAGIFGAAIGFMPINRLHWYLNNNLLVPVYGHYYDTPKLLYHLVNGIVLYFYPPFVVIVVVLGGIIFGIIGAVIGRKKNSRRLWLWAGISGFIFNLFVSFTQ